MSDESKQFCLRCGHPGQDASDRCERCATPRALDKPGLVAGTAFLLNELHAWPLHDVLTPQQRARVETHYEEQLQALIAPARPAAQPAPPSPPVPSVVDQRSPVAAQPARTSRIAPPVTPPPLRTPPPPAKEFDWSWLAEQQANLFLFAGAFLTVVAALIYVGYSGEAVSGGLKMTLLVAYTLAFLAAGVVCLRIERVETAGRVFFGVGAILVPLNFVAVRSFFGAGDLSPESMWLAGSIVTAGFYAAVGYLGLGRLYAFAAGAALVSGVLATCVVAQVPLEWAPLLFIALALAMSLTSLVGPETTRSRIGAMWAPQAHAVVTSATIFAVGLALLNVEDGEDYGFVLGTLWFLPLAMAGFMIYAIVQTWATRQPVAGLGAIGGFGATFVAMAFAWEAPVEFYALVLAGLAVAFGGAMLAATEPQETARLPKQFDGMLRWAAMASTGLAVSVALLVLRETETDTSTYEVGSRWFLAGTFALVAPFYAIDAFLRRERSGFTGLLVALIGAAIGLVYGINASAEYYAFGLVLPAVAFGALALWARHPILDRLHGLWREDTFTVGYAAVASGVGLAVVAAAAGADSSSTYEPQFRPYLALVFVAAAAFAATDALRASRLGAIVLAVASIGIGSGVAYAIDPSAELYAFGLLLPAVLLAAAVRFAPTARTGALATTWRDDVLVVGWAAVAAGMTVALGALAVSEDGTPNPYEPATRWFLPLAFVATGVFAAIDASLGRRSGPIALAAALIGAGCGVTYAFDLSGEMYAFGLLAPAIVVAAAARFAPSRLVASMASTWRDDVLGVGWVAVAAAVTVVWGAILAATNDEGTYEPVTRWFACIAFGLTATYAALDASRRMRAETSAALLLAAAGAIIAVPYALGAQPAYYGVALIAVGALFAVGGRAWTPAWIDVRVRDALGVIGVTAAWVLFEGAYADLPRIGAGVHLGAALFYAGAALTDRNGRTLAGFLDVPQLRQVERVRIAMGWLYLAGLTAVIGYINVLSSLPAAESAEGGTIAGSLLLAVLAFAGAGAVAKRWRPEFRMHLYLMALITALVSLSVGPAAGMLTIALGVYVLVSVAIALYEDQPVLGAPAAVFGFALVAASRQYADGQWWLIPAAYSAIGLAAAALSAAVRSRAPWSRGIAGTGAMYAVAAPFVGFGLLLSQLDESNRIGSSVFYETALYQASIGSLVVVGAMAVGGALVSGRRWIIVPASMALLIALLLQIGRFNPENAQAYTVVIGLYLVGLGLLGLWKFRLIPELAEAAVFVEAAGAAVVMLPSFAQSIEAGWRYQWILLAEAAVFFAGSVVLRRRGMLAVSLLAMALVAGRAMFDAVNAMPNWVVVMVAGVALLAVGMGILMGRDRWSRWQESLMGWWTDAGGEPAEVPSEPYPPVV